MSFNSWVIVFSGSGTAFEFSADFSGFRASFPTAFFGFKFLISSPSSCGTSFMLISVIFSSSILSSGFAAGSATSTFTSYSLRFRLDALFSACWAAYSCFSFIRAAAVSGVSKTISSSQFFSLFGKTARNISAGVIPNKKLPNNNSATTANIPVSTFPKAGTSRLCSAPPTKPPPVSATPLS
ncbi:hypothetical protein SDC9_133465 [bioreactor metagenome]|uniref:Uncharacterized protein n=1 Tax=bioreactor metagenome TaxID=1076179 RepID=A0A645DAC0_9ZZZZ